MDSTEMHGLIRKINDADTKLLECLNRPVL